MRYNVRQTLSGDHVLTWRAIAYVAAAIAWISALIVTGSELVFVYGTIALMALTAIETLGFLKYLDYEYPDIAHSVEPFFFGGHLRLLGVVLAPTVHDDDVFTGFCRAIRALAIIPPASILMFVLSTVV
jgi:hypothetical protein